MSVPAKLAALACAAILALGSTAAHAQDKSALFPDKPVALGAYSMKTLDGRPITSKELRGKVVIVNFWATWCGPCKAEIPDLVHLQAKYKDQLVVIGISEDEETKVDAVKTFAKQMGVNYPMAMATPELRKAFPEWAALPTTFIIDREGRIVFQHMGILDPKLTERQTRALAGLR